MAAPQSRLTPGRLPLVAGAALLVVYAALWAAVEVDGKLLRQLWFMPGIGVLGAIIANTSGTGGGVVFVPVFNALRELGTMTLDPLRVTAVAMGIQCFGMTMGAARWTDRLLHQPALPPEAREAAVRPGDYAKVAVGVLALSLPAMVATQHLVRIDPHDILVGYKIFSVILGLALIVTTWTVNRAAPEQARLGRLDFLVLLALAVPGGILTAFFSVGIGELIALYLFIRHYPVLLCTGVACVISSVSVLVGSLWHIQNGTMQWEVVLLAGPGAAIGGFLARPIALWLGARRLKTLDGGWIVLSGLYLIWLNWR